MLFPSSSMGQPHRVVVTGAGIITSLGLGWQVNAVGFRSGRRAFREVTLFDTTRQRARIAAEVSMPACLPATRLSRRSEARMNRAGRILLHAAHEAWMQSGWGEQSSTPVALGTTSGEMVLGEAYLKQALTAPKSLRGQAARVVGYQVQRQGLDLCNALNLTGPLTTVSNACASGANAIGQAWDWIRQGRFPRVLAGGYDALCQLTFAGFDSLQALSSRPCQPFLADRSGLTLGEGAALLAMETLASAERRGAVILGEIIGYGAVNDSHHLTQPHPEGRAALSAMTLACARAGIKPDQVDYLNAHGTATQQNDATEAMAINQWAGSHVNRLAVSSTKSAIGHLLGAAGAVEAVVCLMALQGQWMPPQTAEGAPDPICQFNLVRQPTDQSCRIALSNSFGFGGANASLVFQRWP